MRGEQDTLKSSAIPELVPEPSWFTDELAELGSKDAALHLNGRWIIELAELDNLSRAEVKTIKAFMSRLSDNFRSPL